MNPCPLCRVDAHEADLSTRLAAYYILGGTGHHVCTEHARTLLPGVALVADACGAKICGDQIRDIVREDAARRGGIS